MKRLIVALALLVGVCVMAGHSLWFLTDARDTMFMLTDEIHTAYTGKDYSTAYEKSQELVTYWGNTHTTLALFFRRHQLDELSESIARLSPYIIYHEDAEILSELSRIRERISSLWDSEQPKLRSVF